MIALAQAVRAHRAETSLDARGYGANLMAAAGAINDDDAVTALAYLDDTPPARRGIEWTCLHATADESAIVFEGFSPYLEDLVATDDGWILARDPAGGVIGWDVAEDHVAWDLPDAATSAIAAGGRWLAAVSPDGLLLWDRSNATSNPTSGAHVIAPPLVAPTGGSSGWRCSCP
ncbi:MAG: hypothetical protein KDA25_12190 [Phycisphaerales bacterium]|nr:hypothetical protein [Phycisphaerales bacterium]